MEGALRADGLGVSYADTVGLLKFICRRFMRAYGGDFEELFAEANYYFIVAYDSFDPTRSSFSNWAARRVWYGLSRARQKEGAKASQISPDTDPDAIGRMPPGDPVKEIKGDLTGEARMVVNLILSAPPEIAELFERRGGRPIHYRAAIRYYLGRRGWPPEKIRDIFAEIREVL